MSKRVRIMSYSAFIMIFSIQILSIVSMCLIKRNVDSFVNEYRQNEAQSYSALLNIEKMSAAIYRHEILVSQYVTEADRDKATDYMREARMLRQTVDDLLIRCDFELRDMEGFEEYELYQGLNDSITAYFNCVDIVYEVKDKNSTDLALYLYNNNLSRYIDITNDYTKETEYIVESVLGKSKDDIGRAVVTVRTIFGIGIVIIIMILLVTVWIARRVFAIHINGLSMEAGGHEDEA